MFIIDFVAPCLCVKHCLTDGSALIVILLPRLDLDVALREGGEGLDVSLSQPDVGHQRRVVVDGSAADAVAVCQFTLGVVLGHIDDEGKAVLGYHVHHVVVAFLVGPADGSSLYAVVVEEAGRTARGIHLVALPH